MASKKEGKISREMRQNRHTFVNYFYCIIPQGERTRLALI